MSEGSRSTQGGQHGPQDTAQDAAFALTHAVGVSSLIARRARRFASRVQDSAKPDHAHICPDCDRVYRCECGEGWKVGYLRCDCLPVVKAEPVPGRVFSEMERLRLENEEMRACLRVAGMLLRGVQSYGNPGHSFRQDTADRCERLAR